VFNINNICTKRR